jgi:hypothetical protein
MLDIEHQASSIRQNIMPAFEPVLLARIGKPGSALLGGYQADGGYTALRKALAMPPDEVDFSTQEPSGADLSLRQRRRKRARYVQ